jgi:hypothetical protein
MRLYVYPAAIDIAIRLVQSALYTPSRIIAKRVRERGDQTVREKYPHIFRFAVNIVIGYNISIARDVQDTLSLIKISHAYNNSLISMCNTCQDDISSL